MKGVLEKFTDTVIAKGPALRLTGDADLRRVIADAHQQTFDEARGLLLDELKGQAGDYGMLAMGLVDARRGRVWEHLERKLRLRKLEERRRP